MKKILILSTLLLSFLCLVTGSEQAKAIKLKVMTFNVRYDNGHDSINNWQYRSHRMSRFIRRTSPDVFGLQEVLKGQLDDLTSALSNYAYVGVGREDGKEKGEYSPVFYRKDRFTLIKSGWFWLSQTPERPTLGWDAACVRIVTWTVLQDKKTEESILFANTHFDHRGIQARQNSAILIKERLSKLSNKMPIILTGDFNMTSHDKAYPVLLNRMLPMTDAWTIAEECKGDTVTFNGFGHTPVTELGKIDFIFLSKGIKVTKSSIIDSYVNKGLYISDHNAHVAEIITVDN